VFGEVFGAASGWGAPEAVGVGFGLIIRFAFCSSVKLFAGCLCKPVVIRYASGVPGTVRGSQTSEAQSSSALSAFRESAERRPSELRFEQILH